MAVSDKVVGVGARRLTVFDLDVNGFPFQAVSSATPETGHRFGIRDFVINEQAPRKITHNFDDAQTIVDYLPPEEGDDLTITAGRTDLAIDAVFRDALVYAPATNVKMIAGGGSTQGFEPYKFIHTVQQAVDADLASSGFGKTRLWRSYVVGAVKVTPGTQGFNTNRSEKTYSGAISTSVATPWQQDIEDADWGISQGSYLEMLTSGFPIFNVFKGNGVLGTFNLSHSPIDDDHLLVWIDGELLVPDTIVTGASPSFTFDDEPTIGQQIMALILTNAPGK